MIILVAIVGGGIYWWQYHKENKTLDTGIKESEDKTASWKTSRNEEYGYEIKYPEDWELAVSNIEPGPISIIGQVEPPVLITKKIDTYHWTEITIDNLYFEVKTISELKEKFGEELRFEGKKTEVNQIGELEALNVVFRERDFETDGIIIYEENGVWFLPTDNLLYIFGYNIREENEEFNNNLLIVDQIISTFRFLD